MAASYAIFAGTGTDTINANDGTQDCIVATIGTDTIHKDSSDLVNPDGGCPAGFWLPAGSAR